MAPASSRQGEYNHFILSYDLIDSEGTQKHENVRACLGTVGSLNQLLAAAHHALDSVFFIETSEDTTPENVLSELFALTHEGTQIFDAESDRMVVAGLKTRPACANLHLEGAQFVDDQYSLPPEIQSGIDEMKRRGVPRK